MPDNLTQTFQVSRTQEQGVHVFVYDGEDGRLEYRYTPLTGTFSDVSASWTAAGRTVRLQPLEGGGVLFAAGEGRAASAPERIELIACQPDGDTVVSRWKYHRGEQAAEVSYTFRLWQKPLVVLPEVMMPIVVDDARQGGRDVAYGDSSSSDGSGPSWSSPPWASRARKR